MAATAIRAGRAFVEIFADDAKLDKVLAGAEKKIKAFGAGVGAVGAKMLGLGAGLAAPFIAATKVWSDMGSEMKDMSDRTGITVESLSALTYAAGQSGASAEDLEIGIKKMNQMLFAAGDGSKDAQGKIAGLGLSMTALDKATPEEQMLMFADAIDNIQDPAGRTAAALDVFGKSGTKLLPLFKGGAASIKEMTDRARELGLVMSTEEAAAAESFGDQLSTVTETVKRAAFAIGASLAPIVADLAERVIKGVAAVAQWIRANAGIVRLAAIVVAGIIAFGAALTVAGVLIYGIGAAIGILSTLLYAIPAIVGFIGTAFTGAFALISGVIGFLFSPLGILMGILIGLAYYFINFKAVAGAVGSYLAGVWNSVKTDAVNAFGAIAQALASGNITAAADVLWSYLKLVWAEGTTWLAGIWDSFLDGLVGTLEMYGGIFQNAWNVMIAGIQVAWEMFAGGFTIVFGGAMYGAIAYVQTLWQFIVAFSKGTAALFESVGTYLFNFFATIYNTIASLLRGLVNVVFSIAGGLSLAFGGAFIGITQTIKDMHTAAKDALGDIATKDTNNPLSAFGDAFNKSGVKSVGENFANAAGGNFVGDELAKRQANIAGINAGLQAQQDAAAAKMAQNDADRTNARNARDDARGGSIAELRKQFNDSVANAKDISDPTKKKAEDAKNAANGAIAGAGAKFSASGTFSGAAAGLLGAGGTVAERTAIATEQTARSTKRIEQQGAGTYG